MESKVRGRPKSSQSKVGCGTEKRKGGQAVCVTGAGSTTKRKRVNLKDRTVSKVECEVQKVCALLVGTEKKQVGEESKEEKGRSRVSKS